MLGWFFGDDHQASTSVRQHSMAEESEESVLISLVRSAVTGKITLDEHSTQEEVDGVLYDAAFTGDSTTALDAIFLGGRPSARNEAGNTSIHAAAAGGHAVVLDLLLKAVGFKQEATKITGRWANTPLHFCCGAKEITEGHEQCVLLLLKHGADALSRNAGRKSPHDMLRVKGGTLEIRIASLLDKQLINLCPWLSDEDASSTIDTTTSPTTDSTTSSASFSTTPARSSSTSDVRSLSVDATGNKFGKQDAEVTVVHFMAKGRNRNVNNVNNVNIIDTRVTDFTTKIANENSRKVEADSDNLPPQQKTTVRKPLIPLVGFLEAVSAASSKLASKTTAAAAADISLFDSDDGLFLFDNGDELDEFNIGDNGLVNRSNQENGVDEYMTPMQLLRCCRIDLNGEYRLSVDKLEVWIDRLSDSKDEISTSNTHDLEEIDDMLEQLESQLAQAFVESAKKATSVAAAATAAAATATAAAAAAAAAAGASSLSLPISAILLAETEQNKEKRRIDFGDNALKQNKHNHMGEILDKQIDKHIDAIGSTIGSTVTRVGRKLLGVPVLSRPIPPTTPQRRERIVVLVQPNREYGLCAQFDEDLVITAFRNVPGTSITGPVESEGVRREDRLIRVNSREVEGMKLDSCLDLLRNEVSTGDGMRMEMEFVRTVIL